MTQEDKELLLKDLCARLPYGVVCRTRKEYTTGSDLVDREPVEGILIDVCYDVGKVTFKALPLTIRQNHDFNVEEIMLYLRPMSSMTRDEVKEFQSISNFKCYPKHIRGAFFDNDYTPFSTFDSSSKFCRITMSNVISCIDWLLKKHFDFKGLIEKGLALPAPDGMYETK